VLEFEVVRCQGRHRRHRLLVCNQLQFKVHVAEGFVLIQTKCGQCNHFTEKRYTLRSLVHDRRD
jgi:hypothetical protein